MLTLAFIIYLRIFFFHYYYFYHPFIVPTSNIFSCMTSYCITNTCILFFNMTCDGTEQTNFCFIKYTYLDTTKFSIKFFDNLFLISFSYCFCVDIELVEIDSLCLKAFLFDSCYYSRDNKAFIFVIGRTGDLLATPLPIICSELSPREKEGGGNNLLLRNFLKSINKEIVYLRYHANIDR